MGALAEKQQRCCFFDWHATCKQERERIAVVEVVVGFGEMQHAMDAQMLFVLLQHLLTADAQVGIKYG